MGSCDQTFRRLDRHTLYLGSDFRDDCRDKRWESRFQNNFKMDSSGVSWSRVRALPFFNMSQIRQLMNGNNPVYGVPRFGNRDFLNTGFDDDDDVDEYDYDKSENMEDESNIRVPTFNELLRRQRPELEGPSETESQSSGLSGDSLAFTLVYVSVFSVTLLYVGLKLAKRWRARQSRVSSTEESPTTPVEIPPCGHPQCSRVTTNPSSSTGRRYMPYTGLGGAWIPEIMTFQGFPLTQAQAQVHNTAVCRGRCGPCRALALPPPSYTKLFLEEQPPAYDDSVVIKHDDDDVANVESVDIIQEANSCTVDIECEPAEESDTKEEASFNSDEDSPENSLLNSNS